MMRIPLFCVLLLSLSSCILGGNEPPAVPEAVSPPPLVAPPPPMPDLTATVTPVHVPEPILTPLWAAKMVPPAEAEAPKPVAPVKGRINGRQAAPTPEGMPSPAQLIEEANRQARLAPTARGYFGGGGTYRYQWTAGRIYDVYLTATSGTKIIFPPGEVLAHELVLNPEAFDVSSVTISTELSKNTVLFIRPCTEGEQACQPVHSVDVALVSESGRSYDLHLIVGKVGMVGVTWAIAPIPQMQVDEAPPAGAGR